MTALIIAALISLGIITSADEATPDIIEEHQEIVISADIDID